MQFDLNAILGLLADQLAEKVSQALQSSNPQTIAPRLLTVEQAAIYLGRTKDSVQHMAAIGKLPVVRTDRRVFLDRKDLDAWIEANKRGPSEA